jgi:hypothetical protein
MTFRTCQKRPFLRQIEREALMPLSELSEKDRQIIFQCLNAVLKGKFNSEGLQYSERLSNRQSRWIKGAVLKKKQ